MASLDAGSKKGVGILGFQRADETFHRRIVVAVAHAVYADLDVMLGQQGLAPACWGIGCLGQSSGVKSEFFCKKGDVTSD